MGSTSQLYSLSWGEFSSSLATAVQSLRDDKDLVDVTLAAGGRSFAAHKIVLCAASPFLLDLLKSTPCQHPVVMLAGVGADELEALLEFVYRGEVSVEPSQLSALLEAAQILNIHGLTPPTVITENGEEIAVSAVQTSEELTSSEGTNPAYQERRKKKKRKPDISPTKCVRGDKTGDQAESNKRQRVMKDVEIDDKSGGETNSPIHSLATQSQVPVSIETTQVPMQHELMPESEAHLHTLMPMQQYSPLHVPQFPATFAQTFSVPGQTSPLTTMITPSGKSKGASDCPGVCPLCGATLRQARNLRRHLLSSCKYRFASIANHSLTVDSTSMMEMKPEIELPGYSLQQRQSYDTDGANIPCEQIICKPSLPTTHSPQSSSPTPTNSSVSPRTNIPSPTIAR